VGTFLQESPFLWKPSASRAKNRLVETFSRAYDAASPNQQAALRAWMRDIIVPRKQRRKDIIRSLRSEKDSIAARYETDLKQTTNAIFATTWLSRGSGEWFSPQ
jgi:hypothetical protein